MKRSHVTLRVATALLLAFGSVFVAVQPALADGNVDVSSNGVAYGSSLSSPLFDQNLRMVPGDTSTEVFYIRNSGTDAGYLRITLQNVVAADADFARALAVSASTAGHSGTPVSVSKASPCWNLLQGQRIAPGETVAVTTTAALGNLDGMAGQGATAGMTVRVTLSELATSDLAPTDCGGSGTDVVVFTPTTQSTRTPARALAAVPGATTINGTVATGTLPTQANTELPTLAFPGGDATVDPNTWRLYQELLVLLMVAALILGSGTFLIIAWRRRVRATNESGA